MHTRLITALSLATALAAGTAFAADMSAPSTGAASPTPSTAAPTTSSTTTTTTSSPAGKMESEKATTASGTIKSFDAKSQTLVFEDGTKYKLNASMKGDDLHAGQKVTVTYQMEGKHMVVTHYDIKA